jgi:UDP-2,4-diacetamido-2,4,6-trideoxy-beta-L-altropyranose hydrolase
VLQVSRPDHPVTTPVFSGRIAFRCDGSEQIGAGHVARCLPLAKALGQVGWKVSFVGSYGGLAGWLLARSRFEVRAPDLESPCGVGTEEYDAAIVDSYSITPAAICELVRTLPVVTLGEANRCPTRGVLLDYHLDRTEPSNAQLLAGPSFAPLDPAFARAGRAGSEIRSVLVTVGGSLSGRRLLAEIVPMVGASFPEADVVLAGGTKSETKRSDAPRVAELPSPSALVDAVCDVDLAVTAAGLTAYELACAGVPQVAIAIATNQRRVVNGLHNRGLAPCLDLTSGDLLADLPNALEQLRDADLRQRYARDGMMVFDGNGARRAAIALSNLFGWSQPPNSICRPATNS